MHGLEGTVPIDTKDDWTDEEWRAYWEYYYAGRETSYLAYFSRQAEQEAKRDETD